MTQLVQISGLSKSFGNQMAVHPLDLEISNGDFLAILGPSGCGKTTLLRMMGGLETPNSGTIMINGQDVTQLGPEKRPTNLVFQGYALFPHMTVRQNVAYGLRLRGLPKAEIDTQVADMLTLVHLNDYAERTPQMLSGGQQQRVALARALVMRPKVLLLDEPLAALDLKLRKAMQAELRRIHRSIGGTFVFVTHDQEEALGLANRIVVMEAGRIVQQGRPEEIYSQPKSKFVSTFVGEANVLSGQRKNGTVALLDAPAFASDGRDGPVHIVLRPEAVILCEPNEAMLRGRVVDLIFLGSHTRILLQLSDQTELAIHAPGKLDAKRPKPNEDVGIAWNAQDVVVIDEAAVT